MVARRNRVVDVTAELDQHGVVHLTTVGRVTGRPHTIEIWFASRESTIYMLSGGRDRSDWVRNLIRTPDVWVRAGSLEYSGLGRVVVDSDEDEIARDAVHAKYAPRYRGDLSRWREAALPVAVDLKTPAS